jgi:hypothetical protein
LHISCFTAAEAEQENRWRWGKDIKEEEKGRILKEKRRSGSKRNIEG